MRFHWSRLATAALPAAAALSGCVSVREYSQVRDQLRVEQRKALERERRAREIELLAEKLRKRLAVAELERAEARTRLGAAENLLAIKPPEADARPVADKSRGELVATVRFSAGGDRLSDDDRARIAEIAELLAGREGVRVVVEGHSDAAPIDRTQGRYRSNMHLSVLRALAVYHEVLSHEGVDPARVAVVGYGEHRPVPGAPEELRRVEVRLVPAEGGARPASRAGP